jgi:hypothetical protein
LAKTYVTFTSITHGGTEEIPTPDGHNAAYVFQTYSIEQPGPVPKKMAESIGLEPNTLDKCVLLSRQTQSLSDLLSIKVV